MKNLKKVLALVLALSMILSTFTALTLTASAAQPTFSDIAGTSYEDAVEVLAALGIVAGYEDGTYGGDKVVTRAEMAAFIVRELGLAATASSATTGNKFTDVAADHWALGSINVANQKKIIVGNGDGTFAPDETVSYQAAVKMLVCALGYEVVANRQGGWPAGYLIQGAAIGLTDGITGIDGADGCNRGVVAALLYNALEINLMEETAYSSSAAQVEETSKTLLRNYQKVIKVYDADIVATATQGSQKTAAGYAKITGTYDYYWDYLSDPASLDAKYQKMEVGETDPDAFFGSAVIVYAKLNGANKAPTILCIIGDSAAQESIDVNVADFYGANAVVGIGETNAEGTNNSKYVKLYYKTEEDTKAQEVKLLDFDLYSDYCTLVVNGVVNPDYFYNNPIKDADGNVIANMSGWKALDTLENGVITLIDAKSFDSSRTYDNQAAGSDGIYEKVVVSTYFDFVVSEVDTEEGIISTQNGVDITLDENKIYTITDVDGAEVAIEDLQEYDVLSVFSDQTNKADVDKSEVINIVVYNNPLEGKVTEKTSKAIYIDGEKYTLAGDLVGLDDFNLDDEGTFYLNAAGEVVQADTTAAAKDYAVFYDVYADGARKIVLNAVTSEGATVELVASSSIDIVTYGVSAGKYVRNDIAKVDFSVTNPATLTDELGILSTNPAVVDEDDNVVVDENGDVVTEYKPYIATYSLKSGSENQIDKIYLAGSKAGMTDSKMATRFAIWADNASLYYNGSEATLGSYGIDASTVIFHVPADIASSADADEIKVSGKSGLSTRKYNNVSIYEVDKNNIAKAVMILTVPGNIEESNPISIIQSISAAKNAKGEDIYKVYMIQDGKLVSKETADDDVLGYYGKGTIGDGYTAYSLKVGYSFYPGAVIQYNEGSDGSIESLNKIYPTTSKVGNEPAEGETPYYKTEYFTTWNNSAVENDYNCGCFIIYGKVAEKKANNKQIIVDTVIKTSAADKGTATTLTANYGSANITVVDYAFEEDAERVSVGTASDIKVGSYVLIRKRYSTTKDIVVYADSFNVNLNTAVGVREYDVLA